MKNLIFGLLLVAFLMVAIIIIFLQYILSALEEEFSDAGKTQPVKPASHATDMYFK